jgi:hypothetical protein
LKHVHISKATFERLENNSLSGFAPDQLRTDAQGVFIEVSDEAYEQIASVSDIFDVTPDEALNLLIDKNAEDDED